MELDLNSADQNSRKENKRRLERAFLTLKDKALNRKLNKENISYRTLVF
jgi:hypothetical protein